MIEEKKHKHRKKVIINLRAIKNTSGKQTNGSGHSGGYK